MAGPESCPQKDCHSNVPKTFWRAKPGVTAGRNLQNHTMELIKVLKQTSLKGSGYHRMAPWVKKLTDIMSDYLSSIPVTYGGKENLFL